MVGVWRHERKVRAQRLVMTNCGGRFGSWHIFKLRSRESWVLLPSWIVSRMFILVIDRDFAQTKKDAIWGQGNGELRDVWGEKEAQVT